MADRTACGRTGVAALVASAMILASGTAEAADHRDSPRLMANIAFEGNADINDTYLFQSPKSKDRTVLITTFSPSAGVSSPAYFHPYVSYEIRIQNTGQVADNFAYLFTFSQPDAFGRQMMQMVKQSAIGQPLATQFGVAPPSAIQNEVVAFGPTGQSLPIKGGGTIIAGLFDDPFFFDSLAFNKFVALAQAGEPLAQRVAPFFPPNIPNNFFGNFNVTAMVIELPNSVLQSSKGNTKFGYWVRTVGGGSDQIDREGRPAVNTAAIPGPYKNVFNEGTPFTDSVLFTAAMIQDITQLYGVSEPYAFGLTQILLPDVLTIDVSKPAAFPNGRGLTDDVIDTEFSLLTNGALTSDRVDNDSVFSNSFPYLGPPQPRKPLP